MADRERPRFQAGGALRPDAVYAERPADGAVFRALSGGTYCHVLATRQSGKSSLRLRTAARLAGDGVTCASLALAELGGAADTADAWYFGLVRKLAEALRAHVPEGEERRFWDARPALAPAERWGAALRDLLLARVPGRLVVFVDEVEALLALPFPQDGLLTAVRSLHDQRATTPALERLTFCLLGSSTARDLSPDPAHGPFAVSQSVELHDFTRAELHAFEAGFTGLVHEAAVALDTIYGFTAGHPYMTQRVCADLAGERRGASPAEVIQERFLLRGRAEDPELSWADRRFARAGGDPLAGEMLALYERVLGGEEVVWDPADDVHEALRLTGLVAPRFDGVVRWLLQVRNRIVRNVFDAEWIRQRREERLLADPITRWIESGRSDETLLRGEDLERSSHWAVGREVSPAERAFLKASQDAARRRRLEKLGLWSFGIAAAILTVAVLVLAWLWRSAASDHEQARTEANAAFTARDSAAAEAARLEAARAEAAGRADRERGARERASAAETAATAAALQATHLRDTALARALAASSLLTGPRWPERQLLLAAEAARLAAETDGAPPPLVEEALREALGMDPLPGRPLPLGSFTAAAVGGDGTTLAVGDEAGAIRVWAGDRLRKAPPAAAPGAPTRTLAAAGPVTALAVAGGGAVVVAGRADGAVLRWTAEGAPVTVATVVGPVRTLATDDAGERIGVVGGDGAAVLWSAGAAAPLALGAEVAALAVTPDGRWAVAATETQGTTAWTFAGAAPETVTLRNERSRGQDTALAASAGSDWLVTAGGDGEVKLWDLSRGPRLRVPAAVLRDRRARARTTALAVAADGDHVVVAGADHVVRLWERHTNRFRVAAVLRGHDHPLLAAGVFPAPDGPPPPDDEEAGPPARVLTVPAQGPARLWAPEEPATVAEPAVLGGHGRGVTALAASPDSRWLVTGDFRGRVRLWELTDGGPRTTPVVDFRAHRAIVTGVAIRPDGTLLTASRDRSVIVWPTLAELRELPPPAKDELAEPAPRLTLAAGAAVEALALAPDGRLVAAATSALPPALWALEPGGREARPLALAAPQLLPGAASPGAGRAIALSPDASRLVLATTGAPGPLAWTLGSAAPQPAAPALGGPGPAARTLAFLADGTLAAGFADGRVGLWRGSQGPAPTLLPGAADGAILAVAASPRGDRLAAGDSAGAVLVWTLAGAAAPPPVTLRAHEDAVRVVAFTPDGRWLVTGADDGTAHVRRVATAELVALACHLVGRELTPEEWHEAAGPLPAPETCAATDR